MAVLPLPADPLLREIAGLLEDGRFVAELWDHEWRVAYLTSDYLLSAGAGTSLGDAGLGEYAFSAATLALRDTWPAGATTASFAELLVTAAPWIAHDLPGGAEAFRAAAAPGITARVGELVPAPPPALRVDRVEVKFGTATRPFKSMSIRLLHADGGFAGTCSIVMPALPGAIISLLGTGDHATLERTLALLRPGRRPGAVLFVDLEGSSQLARRLSTAAFFALIRRLVFRIDEEVVSRGGVVGKHAGDGASAFFLAETLGGESAAAKMCLAAAGAIRGRVAEVAERSGLAADELSLRFGLHWGDSLYMGRLLTGGRTEVTGLGEEVNEAARIEACASGGRTLASKALIERISEDDAREVGIDPVSLRYIPLADVPGATAKAARDAPSIAVCELSVDPSGAARLHAPASHDGVEDRVAIEEPLEIRVRGEALAVTMRTPGHDEELAVGFLHGEGLLGGAPRSVGPTADLAANIVDVDAELLRDPGARRFYTTSSCGVCGKGALEAVAVDAPRAGEGPRIARALLASLPDHLSQPGFALTGGLHATGLFTTAGELLVVREDVGRHNAMDKVIGRRVLDGAMPLAGLVLCVSGRLSFELVQKAAVAGAPILVGVGAPTSLAISLAADRNLTLAGFARGGDVNVYTAPERVT